jgi:hypothetical protein
MCPSQYTTDGKSCFGNASDTIIVSNGETVRVDCASGELKTCEFTCPSTSFKILAGGTLFLVGRNRMILSGGQYDPRVVVDSGGKFDAVEVNITE